MENDFIPCLVIITSSYPDSTPGSEAAGSFVEDLATELAKHIKVIVLAPSLSDSIMNNGNLIIQRFSVPSLPLSLLNPIYPHHWHKIIKTLHAGKQTLKSVLNNNHVNHIFALWALPSGYWAYTQARSRNIPYSIWALGSDIWALSKIPIVKNILGTVLTNSTYCFADGYLLKEDVETISGRACHFLPSTRSLHNLSPRILSSQPPYRYAFLGRWHYNKGIDLLLEALEMLPDTDWQHVEEIRICGGGPLENIVRAKVNRLSRLGRPVSLSGYLGKDDATALLNWTDYLIIPSRIESIPVILSDAIQMARPVIATPVGDLKQLVTNNGIGIMADGISANSIQKALSLSLNISPTSFSTKINKLSGCFNNEVIAKDLINKYLIKPN